MGRPATGIKRIQAQISLRNKKQKEKLKKLGGSKWIQMQIDKS